MSLRPAAALTGSLAGLCVIALAAVPVQAAPLPDASRTADLEPPVPVAHRGASGYAPENTLAAVDAARELDVKWVENDVQRTKDGELVVLHDTTLNRTTDVEEVFPGRAPWRIADFTAAEIARLDAGSWFGPQYAGERVPTLGQFLRHMDGTRQNLLLEIKRPDLYPGIEAEILGELRAQGWLDRQHVRSKLVIQSFDAASVRAVHQQAPTVKTGFLGTPAVADLPEYALFTDQINPAHTTVTAEYVRRVQALKGVHGKPMEVFTWTVNDAAAARRVAAMGVDGIISNKPDVVRDATASPVGDEPQDDSREDRRRAREEAQAEAQEEARKRRAEGSSLLDATLRGLGGVARGLLSD